MCPWPLGSGAPVHQRTKQGCLKTTTFLTKRTGVCESTGFSTGKLKVTSSDLPDGGFFPVSTEPRGPKGLEMARGFGTGEPQEALWKEGTSQPGPTCQKACHVSQSYGKTPQKGTFKKTQLTGFYHCLFFEITSEKVPSQTMVCFVFAEWL